jgi:hypothetical protein
LAAGANGLAVTGAKVGDRRERLAVKGAKAMMRKAVIGANRGDA